MSTNSRQPKAQRKGMPDVARRTPAWTGSRASPTFSPAMNSPRLPNGSQAPKDPSGFPPLSQTNGSRPSETERILQSLTGLIGTTVTVSTKTSQRYEGVIVSTSAEGDTTGVTLKDVKEISSPGALFKDQLFIASTNIDTWSSGPADAKALNGDSFKTDTDISQKAGARRERELTAWSSTDSSSPPAPVTFGALNDDATFGPGAAGPNGSWDQFAANEKLFGVKTNFDEDVYTTKLDRNAADYKERERKAQQIANEIMGSSAINPHIREERTMDHTDDTGVNEEEKYAGVVRSANAYVPPGARKVGVVAPEDGNKPEIPKVSVNAPDGSAIPPTKGSPAPTKPSADPVPAFRDFVTTEKQRLTQKKQALMKNERDKRMADFLKFSQSFKLKKPIPDDLVPILAKDEDKQRQIREKTTQDAGSDSARAIGQTASTITPLPAARVQPVTTPAKSGAGASVAKMAGSASTPKTVVTKMGEAPTKRTSLFIQPIPPFKGRKSTTPVQSSNDVPTSPTAGRLNVNASSFKPNPKAVAFTPSASPANTTGPSAANASPKPKAAEAAPSKPNPFFGTQITKKTPAHIKDDFNPFKYHKVAEASAVSAMWPYNGKRYVQMFPAQATPAQQQSPHMAPPIPPPVPPPSYEEDSAAQQAAAQSRGYVYAYPPYYPGQPMMPGMAPPPPGAYMPSPYMHPMHYQHAMPPPNGMYPSPSMGQMPPPGAYMPPPPPPGTYPPPPNSAGPRPSMPPTPIPAHAHPYYTQSPQLQHAVPYQMMMQPGQHVPHPYEGAPVPPVPMGGVGHA